MTKQTKERGNVSLDPQNWTMIDNHIAANRAITNRSASLRDLLYELEELRKRPVYTPITMTPEQYAAEREAGNNKPQRPSIDVCRECDKPVIDCEFCLVTKDSR